MSKYLDSTGTKRLIQKLDARYAAKSDSYTKAETDAAISTAISTITNGDEVSY